MGTLITLLVIGILALGVWVGLFFFYAYSSGWKALAKKYKTASFPNESSPTIITLKMNSFYYRNQIAMVLVDKGVFLKVTSMYRLTHPPVFVPWNDIPRVDEKSSIDGGLYQLYFGNPPVATADFPKDVFGKQETMVRSKMSKKRTLR